MKRRLRLTVLVMCLGVSWAQTPSTKYLLDWLPKPQSSPGFIQSLHDRLDHLVHAVNRYTSPDIPRESRRLWKISIEGQNKCLLTMDTGVHFPRWGRGGYILYLVEADTNGDQKIDSLDDYLIRIVPEGGGAGRTIGQGKSAVWSPDGKYIAFVRGGGLQVVNLSGEAASSDVPEGRIVMANSLNPEVARNFWAVDPRTGASDTLPSDLEAKYLSLAMLSPSGSKVVYSNTMKTSLIVAESGQTTSKNLTADSGLILDPAWSPDEKQIVYVSTSKGGSACSPVDRPQESPHR